MGARLTGLKPRTIDGSYPFLDNRTVAQVMADRGRVPFAETIANRGYQPVYRTGTACPGCGSGHWSIGRQSAECVSCGTALPIAPEVSA
jgi:Fe-S cluster biogenesis protein NfuA